jgi:hypothetical protein
MGIRLKRLIVVPRNGYLNRLQAMASTSILAEQLGAEFSVSWLPQVAAPAPQEVVFASESELRFTTESELEQILGFSLESFPRYVNFHAGSGIGKVITLAGHDLGEQPLMSDFAQALRAGDFDSVVIVAGGRFSMNPGSQSVTWDSVDFRNERSTWYQTLKLAPEIDSVWPKLTGEPFVGLHLRYSDRSHQTPSRAEIKRAVVNLCRSTGIDRVFVASDSRQEREHWCQIISGLGLFPWVVETGSVPSSEFMGDVLALIDWRILTKARATVFFAESSFGYEAAVASGNFDQSVALAPNSLVSLGVQVRGVVQNLLGAPKRRGWL